MSQTTTQYVAAEVRAQMGRQGCNIQYLAAQLGVSDMWVSRRLRSLTEFTVDDLMRVAAVLNADPAQFLPPVTAEQVAA